MAFKLTFYGGAESVTGSNFLVQGTKGKVLVDCGMEQGRDFCQECMYEPFAYDVKEVDALIITHAHLDHIGRAPKLVREGFRGKVYMTPPTRDLMELILRDSVHILAEEAKKIKVSPLYDEKDLNLLLDLVELVPYNKEWEAAPGISAILRNTGHILGSGSVRLTDEDGTTLALTGDIGNSPTPLLPDAVAVPDADAMVIESVYGDRLHDTKDVRVDRLRDAINKAVAKDGVVLIPAFSMERTQLMLYELSNLMEAKEIPEIPVYLDSPLAIAVTEVYEKWAKEYFKNGVQTELAKEGSLFRFPFLSMTRDREESESIRKTKGSKIIIAGAGMSHGGRIGKHEALYLPDPHTTLLVVGYQAPRSPGRRLVDGAKSVRLDGRDVTVNATVEMFGGWSAHADRDGLLEYAKKALPRTKTFFVALGEPASARFLAQRIHGFLGVKAIVPTQDETWEITKEGVKKV
ncbi:MBL fold metallo-hydrolase [Patescibacteria group bacterium]|nr:MBL fold metallo-hydrolase [Patescibacteria group bacterium]MBU1755112.1 MBL fold metallo-hydrolase [Patescibacteria group bacterium]